MKHSALELYSRFKKNRNSKWRIHWQTIQKLRTLLSSLWVAKMIVTVFPVFSRHSNYVMIHLWREWLYSCACPVWSVIENMKYAARWPQINVRASENIQDMIPTVYQGDKINLSYPKKISRCALFPVCFKRYSLQVNCGTYGNVQ